MKRLIPVMVLLFILSSPSLTGSEVISERIVPARKVEIILRERIRLPLVVDNRIVFSEIGNNQIRNLQRIDFFLDRDGHLQGVRIIYNDRVGGAKSFYFPSPKAIMFEHPLPDRPSRGKNEVRVRVLTTDELINVW